MPVIRPFGRLPSPPPMEYNDAYVSSLCIRGFLDRAETEALRELWTDESAQAARVMRDRRSQGVDYGIRRSRVVFLDPAGSDWIYKKLAMVCIVTNARTYRFDITGFQSRLQLTQYGPDGFFTWHSDFGPGPNSARKLSVAVQLSDPGEYDGGDLQFLPGEISAPRARGTAVIFPSFLLHRVTPVTAGTRWSLVGWIAGPPYR